MELESTLKVQVVHKSMDPPDMSFARGRELLDPSPEPPVRLLTRPSVPFNGPEVLTVQDGSLGAYVDAKEPATSEVLPTSPGKTRSQLPGASYHEDYLPPQAGGRAVSLQLTIAIVYIKRGINLQLST